MRTQAFARLFAMGLLMLGYSQVQAQSFFIPTTGFNADVVADGVTAAGGTPATSTTDAVDGTGTASYVFLSENFTIGGTACGVLGNRLPTSRTITSTNTTNGTSGLVYTLADYGNGAATNNNALRLAVGASGALTAVTPFQATKLLVVGLGGASEVDFSVTVTYTDNSTETISAAQVPNMPDWCGGSASIYRLTTQQYWRIARSATTCTGGTSGTCQYLYEIPVALGPASYTKTIASVSFTNTNAGYLHIMALGAQAACPAPTAQATGLSLTPVSTGSINGSFTAASPAPTGGYLVVRYPSGATAANPASGTVYTAGNAIGSGTVVYSGTGTSFSASGLSGGTTYDFYVYSYTAAGATCGGPVYLNASPLTSSAATNACGAMSGTVAVGPGLPNTYPGGFSSLTQALNYINTNGLGGNTILELQSGYDGTSANETFPITFPVNPCVNSTKTLTVRPAAGVTGLTITNSTAAPTIYFNGATYVTIDGRPGGTGSLAFPNAGNLAIISTSTLVNGVAVKMANEASNNVLRYCDLQGANATNGSNTDCGVVIIAGTTGLNGNDNNTISYCNIHGAGATLPAIGVYSYGYTGSAISAASTFNDNNTVSNCNIYDFFSAGFQSSGLKLQGGTNAWTVSNNRFFQTGPRTYTTGNQHRAIWVTPADGGGGNGFTISNNYIGGSAPDGTGTYTMNGAVASNFWAMDVSVIGSVGSIPATASTVSGNTFTGFNLTANALSGTDFLRFISMANTGNVNVTNNIMGSGTGTGAITVMNNGTSSGVSAFGIKVANTGLYTVSGNTIGSITLNASAGTPAGATASTQFTGILVSNGTSVGITNNTIGSATTNNSIQLTNPSTSGTAQFINAIHVSGGTAINGISGNTVANLHNAYNGTASGGSVRGIYISSSTPTIGAIADNVINNLSNAAPQTNGAPNNAVVGIGQNNSNAAGCNVTGNTIDSLVATNASAAVQVVGIYYGGTASVTNTIAKNYIHSLYTPSTSTTAYLTGIDNGGGSNNLVNNMISLGAKPDGTSNINPTIIRGIASNSNSTTKLYYNSIYIGGTGATNTASSYAFIRTATSGTYDIRNNIFANARSFTAAGSSTIGNYAIYFTTSASGAAPNYNLYYAPGTGGFVGYTGSAQQVAYAPNWISGDASSQSGDPLFIAPTGTPSAINLHLNTGGNVAESGGVAIAGFNDDFDGDVRQGSAGYSGSGTAPDLGADEFAGAPIVPIIASATTNPSAINCLTSTARTVTATVTATGAAIIGAQINYTINGVAQAPITMSLSSGTGAAGTTSTYTGTIPAVTPANATVAWSVSVTTGSANAASTIASYQDAPLTGVTAVATASLTALCSGSSTTLSSVFGKPAQTGTLGTGSATSTTLGQTPVAGGWGGMKSQFIIRASELTAAGYVAGPMTSLGITLTSAGQAMPGFAMDLQTTALTSLTSNIEATSNNVYSTGTFTPVVGLNTFPFSTPFNWDGISNLIVSFCWSNQTANSTASTTQVDNVGFNAGNVRYVDSKTPAQVCGYTGSALPSGWNGAATATTFRPKFTIVGTKAVNMNSYAWSDGSTTVGTTNPLTVTPTNTTSSPATINYTVSGTDANNCSVTSNTVAVTVNPQPLAPNGTNSSQCGSGVPTASVTDPNGFSGPVFKWYTTSTGGTPVQTGGSTYTGSVSTVGVNTFYVSVTNPTTLCESARMAVTVTVSNADVISISGSSTSCANSPLALSVTQSGGNNNPYTFTWSATPAAGSGVTGAPTGSSQSFTPTAGGTYTYTVTATDASNCSATATYGVTVLGLGGSTFNAVSPGCGSPNGTITVTAVDAVATTASVYTNNFTSATLNPSEATIAGNASITGGVLQLTPATNSLLGGFVVMNTTGVNPNTAMNVDYDFITTGTPGGENADGMSWSFGDDVIATPSNGAGAADGTTVAPGATNAENGSGTKVKVSFDAYGAAGGPGAAGIYVMYNNTIVNPAPTVTSSMLAYSNNVTWKGSGASKHITISINASSQLTVKIDNTPVTGLTNVQLPAAYTSANKSNWKHAFSARTGGLNETHQLDNMAIQYTGSAQTYEYSINGTNWQSSNTFSAPQGTYPVQIRYTSTPGCVSNLGNAVLNAPTGGPVVSVTPTSGTYCTPGPGVVLTASSTGGVSPVTFAWSPAAGLSATTGATVTATPAAATTYTVTGTDATGCTSTATATIAVNGAVSVSNVAASATSVCVGGSTTLTAAATYAAPASQYVMTASSGTFTPLVGGTNVAIIQADDVASGTIPIGFSFGYETGSYTTLNASSNGFLSFGGANGAATNNLATGTQRPLIAPLWDDLQGNAGNASYLTTGTAPNRVFTMEWLNYKWNYQAGAPVISFQAKLYEANGKIEFIYRQESGAYSAGTTGGASIGLGGAASGNFLSLNNTSASPTASNSTEITNITTKPATGQVYTFDRPAASAASVTWTESPAGSTLTATTGSPVTANNITAASTVYTATVTQSGCSASGSVTVSTGIPLSCGAITTGGATTCAGIQTLTAHPTGGGQPYIYTWTEDGSPFTGAGAGTATITTNSGTHVYNVVIGDQCSNSCNSSISVTTAVAPVVSVTPSTATYCAPTGVTLTASNTGTAGPVTYAWTPAAGLSAASGAEVTATPAATTTYTVTATSANGCIGTATAAITRGPDFTVGTPTATPATACAGSTTQLQVNAGGLAGNYCMSALPTTFGIHYVNDISIAAGAAPLITNNASGQAGSYYTDYGTTKTTGNASTGTTYSISAVNGSTATNWGAVTVFIDYNQDGSFSTAERVFAVYDEDNMTSPYTGTFVIPATAYNGPTKVRVRSDWAMIPATGCQAQAQYGETEDYTINITGGAQNPNITFAWTPAAGLSNAAISNPVATLPATAGTTPEVVTYNVVSSYGGCSITRNVAVTVNPAGLWLGITNNWNAATNWCGGVPTASSDVIIPNATTVPASPNILSGNTGSVHNIQLDNGSVLTAAGGATLNLYGNVNMTGAASFIADGATVNFAGNATQTILPGFGVGTLNVSGGSMKMLSGDVTVSGALNFTSGMIDVGNHTLDLTNNAAISGAGSTSYVKTSAAGGSLSQQVGATPVLFPVGNAAYNPATLTNAGAADVYSVGVRDEVQQEGASGGPVNPATTYAVNHTWDIEEAQPGGSSVTLTLQWNSGETNTTSFDYDHVYISHYDGTSWDIPYTYAFMAPAAGGSGPFTATRSGITSFSPFAVGSAGGSSPLPVTLVRLEATNEGSRNKVEWESATEHDLASYIVERSTDGKSFARMDEVSAAGKAQGYITYDNNPAQGLTYYRLKMIDYSGAFVYSQTVKAFMGRTGEVVVTAAPNPLRDVLTVSVYGAQDGQAQLTDVSGRVVASAAVQSGQATFNTSALAAGTYFVKWSNGAASQTIKVSKQ